jgi:hypothetical protein
MSQDTPDKNLMGLVAHPSDQSVFVMTDIKDRASAVNVRAAESLAHVHEAFPISVGCDVIPSIERYPALWVKLVELSDSAVRDDAHSLSQWLFIAICLYISFV